MPGTMFNPYPVEFVQLDDGDILLRIEEHDNERLIHMSSDFDPASQPPQRLGVSVGRWENERTLVAGLQRRFRPTRSGQHVRGGHCADPALHLVRDQRVDYSLVRSARTRSRRVR